MVEFIDREAAMSAVLGGAPDAHYPGWYASILMNVPAADVAPVVHGRFVHIGPRFAGGINWWNCSICDSLVSGAETRFVYCPHCGAKMDGGDSDGR